MIETRALSKRFGPRRALAGITLSVKDGEVVALVGPNGAGKTTLLRILATLGKAESGSVEIAGHDLSSESEEARRHIGFLSHHTLLYDNLTARQNLQFYARMYDVEPASHRIGTLLHLVGLGLRQADLVRTFSRGMKQRLAVTRAVLHRPDLLLLDEPFAGLDPQGVQALRDLLDELGGGGTTILLTTHNLGHALSVGKRVLVLHRGELVYDQPRRTVQLDAFSNTYDALTGPAPASRRLEP